MNGILNYRAQVVQVDYSNEKTQKTTLKILDQHFYFLYKNKNKNNFDIKINMT